MMHLRIPFDPIKRAGEIEKIVMKNLARKYYRFRCAPYYNNIVTADAVGCCFLCAPCWNYFRNLRPEKYGEFYSPEEVAEKLLKIARKRNTRKFRISGAEPILGESSLEHFIKVVELVGGEAEVFVLETNGLILGYKEELCEKLKPYENLWIRISIKGWDPASFELISGAKGEYFEYPFRALKRLLSLGLNAWPAVMYELFGSEGIRKIDEKLREMRIRPEELELEYIELYPFVAENLKRRGVELKAKP